MVGPKSGGKVSEMVSSSGQSKLYDEEWIQRGKDVDGDGHSSSVG